MQSIKPGRRALLLFLILVVAALLRLSGLSWGLPDREHPAPDYFHPDEFVTYEQGLLVFDAPAPVAFAWGGVLNHRISHLARALVGSDDPRDGLALRRTMILLRALNVLYALLTVLLVAHLGRTLFGERAGMLAAALFAVFPGHVLDCHYARPDVLVTFLLTASLAASVRTVVTRKTEWLVVASVLAGLSFAAMHWGLAAFAGVAAAGALASRGRGVRHLLFSGLVAFSGGLCGYLLGSVETLLHFETFRAQLELSSSLHRSAWTIPLLYLGHLSFYSCGLPTVLLAWAGVAGAAVRRIGAALVPGATLVVGYALLGSQRGAMMRYVVWLTPVLALFAGFALAALGRGLAARGGIGRPLAVVLTAAALLYVLLLSASYVLPMQFNEEPRRAVARRISEVDPHAVVGVTASFGADRTYQPRFPADTPITILELRLFQEFDPEMVLADGPPWIVTTDFARQHAWLESARTLLRRLRAGPEYAVAFTAGPPWRPLSLATLLGFDRPDDLLYVRLEFEALRRGGGR